LYIGEDIEIDDQVKDINAKLEDIREGRYKILNSLIEEISCIGLFPGGDKRNVFAYNILISKVGNQVYNFINADAKNDYKIDRLHECWCSSAYLSLVSNQHYKSLLGRNEDRVLEQSFRDRYEEPFWMLSLLLHHERQAYLIYRRAIVSEANRGKKQLRVLKKKIIDLLTCYSFKLVSEETDIQNWYSEYRNVLKLSEYEQTFSDLIFRLNDELDKNKEKKVTIISLFIAVFGLFQLISVVLDIITFVTSH